MKHIPLLFTIFLVTIPLIRCDAGGMVVEETPTEPIDTDFKGRDESEVVTKNSVNPFAKVVNESEEKKKNEPIPEDDIESVADDTQENSNELVGTDEQEQSSVIDNTVVISQSNNLSSNISDYDNVGKLQSKVTSDADSLSQAKTSKDIREIKASVVELQSNFEQLTKMIKDLEASIKKPYIANDIANNVSNVSPPGANMPYGSYWYGFNPFGMYGVGFHKNHAKSKRYNALQNTQTNYRAGSFNYVANDSMKPQTPYPMVPFY